MALEQHAALDPPTHFMSKTGCREAIQKEKIDIMYIKKCSALLRLGTIAHQQRSTPKIATASGPPSRMVGALSPHLGQDV